MSSKRYVEMYHLLRNIVFVEQAEVQEECSNQDVPAENVLGNEVKNLEETVGDAAQC